MDNSRELTQLFKRLDSAALTELGVILASALLLIIALQRVLPWIANRLHGAARHYLLASVPLLRLAIIVTALVLSVPILVEPSLQNMVAVLGAAGLAIGFALKDYVSSLIAGVVAAFENPYRPGDWIEIDGVSGEVTHVGMRTVDIVTAGDDRVSIPHIKLWSTAVHNANNGTPRMQCAAAFYVHPEHDGRQVRAVLEDVAISSPYLHLDTPVAVVAAEQAWGTLYRIRAYPIDPRQQFRFVTDLTVRGRLALTRIGARPLRPADPGPV